MSQPARVNLVLGTAGHIDHGKTTLVRALTGQDTDRLPEEKARGITIELGFAWLDLADGTRLAIVDVPGHERLVRTMVAGASGIDLVLLVVAADEGVMPQTREHLAICRLLGLERGLVALSKCDQVDAEMRALAEAEIRDALAGGPLAQAPIVPVSALSGAGIPELVAQIERLVATTRGEPEAPPAPARLWVDRVFEKHGFGTIATGTWSGRGLEVGSAVALEPGERRARIRGLERHGEAIAAAEAGTRVAVNLQGVALDQVRRGDLVGEPDGLAPSLLFDVALEWISRDAYLEEPTSVELLVGTAERRARIAPIGDDPIEPGAGGFARLHVDGEPLALLPGDRFVLRGFAREAGVGATVGGGRILDVDPPHRRRSDPRLTAELARLAAGSLDDALLVRIERAGLAGASEDRLRRTTGCAPTLLRDALERLVASQSIDRLGASLLLAHSASERLAEALVAALDAHHRDEPLQRGLPRATLVGKLPANVPAEVASALVARLAQAGTLALEDQLVRRADFRTRLDPEQERLAAALRSKLAEAELEAPALRTLAEALAIDPARLRAIAHHLEREGELVAAPEELFFARASVERLIARVVAHFEAASELDTQTLKNLIGASRRTAMPLMALLDDLQITRRDGAIRRLLHREARWQRGRAGSGGGPSDAQRASSPRDA